MSNSEFTYRGACSCGAVTMRYSCGSELREQTARACQCEFCAPRAYTYLSDPQGALSVSVRDKRWLYAHRFSTGTADFMHCARCNTQVFVRAEVAGSLYGLVCAERLEQFSDVGTIAPADYDGESLDERLGRRAQNWIARLEIIEQHAV